MRVIGRSGIWDTAFEWSFNLGFREPLFVGGAIAVGDRLGGFKALMEGFAVVLMGDNLYQ